MILVHSFRRQHQSERPPMELQAREMLEVPESSKSYNISPTTPKRATSSGITSQGNIGISTTPKFLLTQNFDQ
ncbi:4734_t:CDS:2 [Dentiscutata erythropus]|uniref:4734_t:CDS:1 n=1 Tax=Dentiscutata erythropus TaxID=1348616 RepID=A0A9N9NDD7_9GLOM|nr:4734_t:CDS:2 [Dentiscutata erythropus]